MTEQKECFLIWHKEVNIWIYHLKFDRFYHLEKIFFKTG